MVCGSGGKWVKVVLLIMAGAIEPVQLESSTRIGSPSNLKYYAAAKTDILVQIDFSNGVLVQIDYVYNSALLGMSPRSLVAAWLLTVDVASFNSFEYSLALIFI